MKDRDPICPHCGHANDRWQSSLSVKRWCDECRKPFMCGVVYDPVTGEPGAMVERFVTTEVPT